ncbi:MAG: ribonuclease P protein component [Gammaproteobacteria bacterium]|nr:MAG: ribonuclease P protein component [Gammaproteobacteria bacterium]
MVAEWSFPRTRKLRKPDEFGRVYRDNQHRVRGQYFTVLAFSRFREVDNNCAGDTIRQSIGVTRLGVVVSKKVSKLAVQRNRIKRLIRESFRHQDFLPKGVDFVVIAKPKASQASNEQLVKELTDLWKKVHRRCATYSSP